MPATTVRSAAGLRLVAAMLVYALSGMAAPGIRVTFAGSLVGAVLAPRLSETLVLSVSLSSLLRVTAVSVLIAGVAALLPAGQFYTALADAVHARGGLVAVATDLLALTLDEEHGGHQVPHVVASACMAWFTAANIGTAAYSFLTMANASLLLEHGADGRGPHHDRQGPRPVLLVCGMLYPAALVALTVLVLASAHGVWIGAIALIAARRSATA